MADPIQKLVIFYDWQTNHKVHIRLMGSVTQFALGDVVAATMPGPFIGAFGIAPDPNTCSDRAFY